MMQLKIYSSLFTAILFFAGTAYAQVVVPVYDMKLDKTMMQVNDTIYSKGSAITTAVEVSQKATTEIINQVAQTDLNVRRNQIFMEAKKKNEEKYSLDPLVGARIKAACNDRGRARAMMTGQASKKDVYKKTQDQTKVFLDRGRYASPSEPIHTTSANTLLAQFKTIDDAEKKKSEKTKGALVDTAFSGLSTKPDEKGNSEYTLEGARKNYLINPFPDRLPSNYDEIKQPSATAMQNATAKIKVERLREAATKVNRILSNRATVYDDAWAKSWYSNKGSDGIEMKALAMGANGAQGWYSTLEAANRYRIMNPQWITHTTIHASDTALLKDNNLMLAQMLATMQEMLILLADASETAAQHYALDVENYGRNDAHAIIKSK